MLRKRDTLVLTKLATCFYKLNVWGLGCYTHHDPNNLYYYFNIQDRHGAYHLGLHLDVLRRVGRLD